MEAYILEVTDYREPDAYIGGCFTCFNRAVELMEHRLYDIDGEVEQKFLVNDYILAEAVVWDGMDISLRCRVVKQNLDRLVDSTPVPVI